jgi:hypothetical protein
VVVSRNVDIVVNYEMDKGRGMICLGEEGVKHLRLRSSEARKLRMGLLNKNCRQ